MSEAHAWNGMSQAQLDAAYNNMAAVHDSAERLARLANRSTTLRAQQPGELDIAYGPGPRNRFDVFRCGKPAAPVVVFLHGGWWQRNSKETFSAVAEGPLARGMDVALIGYTLAPDASLRTISAEVHAGIDEVMLHQARHGMPQSCVLSGWSAGGHLTAHAMGHRAVTAGLAVSGVFDLEPIRHSYINDKLRLPAADVRPLSPGHCAATEKPLAVTFGLAELPEMQRQSAVYLAWCAKYGNPAFGLPLAGHDHFSILDELVSPDGTLVHMLSALCRNS